MSDSFSHCVALSVVLVSDRDSGVQGKKVSRVSLVDLAGSERANKTGAQGSRLKEGSNINKSLTTLGLVISKLADSSSAKSKDTFIPYRDSTLTWLLKDNLGGNSRTVMLATISPAGDNYEETLSTLRYADRAKRITNYAVVNEDNNAKIIRELRAEVEMLRKMLSEKKDVNSDELLEKLSENEKIMKNMSLTWEEKVARSGQNMEGRRQALEKMGVHLESRGIKMDNSQFFLINLSQDPSMNELLVYYLKEDVTRVGGGQEQDIRLFGLGIKSEQCKIEREEGHLLLSPLPGAKTCINGAEKTDTTRLKHGDRILWGSNNFFRVNCPSTEGERSAGLESFDWANAQEEVLMSSNNKVFDSMMTKLSQKYHEEKLEAQRRDGEAEDPDKDQRRHKEFKSSLERLKSGLLKASEMVRQANFLASELQRPVKYSGITHTKDVSNIFIVFDE